MKEKFLATLVETDYREDNILKKFDSLEAATEWVEIEQENWREQESYQVGFLKQNGRLIAMKNSNGWHIYWDKKWHGPTTREKLCIELEALWDIAQREIGDSRRD